MRLSILASFLGLVVAGAAVVGLSAQRSDLPEVEVFKTPT